MLEFEPNLASLVWGTESWEVSARASRPSVVASGPLAGRGLDELRPGLPLLFKVIDARLSLSVQVHPSEAAVAVTGGEPKTEMWCVLEPGPFYVGFRPGVGLDDVKRAVVGGTLEDLLVRRETKRFETYFIPGGMVHAVGAGTKVYEVQQSSDTTFRLYDWGRVGADGRPRELHVDKALAALDFSLPPPEPADAVRCAFFDFSQRILERAGEIAAPEDSFLVVYEVEAGRTTFLDAGERMTAGPGRVFLTTLPQ